MLGSVPVGAAGAGEAAHGGHEGLARGQAEAERERLLAEARREAAAITDAAASEGERMLQAARAEV